MFTIKLYAHSGSLFITEAESFSVLRGEEGGEITCHQKDGNDRRFDVRHQGTPRGEGWPDIFRKAIIENAMGKTTEIVRLPVAERKGIPVERIDRTKG